MKWFVVVSSLSILISACTAVHRSPSSLGDDARALRIQEIDLELSKYWNNDWTATQRQFQVESGQPLASHTFDERLASDPQVRTQITRLLEEREREVSHLSKKLHLRHWNGVGPWFSATFRPRLFDTEEVFEIKSLSEFRLDDQRPQNAFPLEHRFYSSYTLRLVNALPLKRDHVSEEREQKYLRGRLECNGDIIRDDDYIFFKTERRSRVYDFNWYYDQINGQRIRIKFGLDVTSCELKYYDPETTNTWTHRVQLKEISTMTPEWIRLTSQIDVCARPLGPFELSTTRFFWQQDYLFTTCPQNFDKMINLRDPYVSMNRKIMSLTGSPLSRKDFDSKNPLARLNFNKAPNFDVIWVSSLNFSADFYGTVLANALRYHAEKGTQIRILVPEVTMTQKDKQVLERLQFGLPNVKIQYYKYRLTGSKDGSWIDKFHRVNHTKLMIGYSHKNPKDSFLITGGRNIRDSYIFSETPVYKAYKFLKNYGAGEEPYIYYDDFEIELRGPDFVQSVMAQMLTFWMRDPKSNRFRSTNINIPKEAPTEQVSRLTSLPTLFPLVRHIMSLPFFDGYQLEKFYIEMIDSAERELLLTTPYFRPSLAISAALDRAVQRGVKVKVLTRIHLAGDGTPQIAEDVNKQGINRHLKDVEIYEWTDEHSIMHAKLLVIDRQLSFVSSVNLNRRSFIHDTESGALILHGPTAEELRNEIMNYLSGGRRISNKEKVSWINSKLIDWADSYF